MSVFKAAWMRIPYHERKKLPPPSMLASSFPLKPCEVVREMAHVLGWVLWWINLHRKHKCICSLQIAAATQSLTDSNYLPLYLQEVQAEHCWIQIPFSCPPIQPYISPDHLLLPTYGYHHPFDTSVLSLQVTTWNLPQSCSEVEIVLDSTVQQMPNLHWCWSLGTYRHSSCPLQYFAPNQALSGSEIPLIGPFGRYGHCFPAWVIQCLISNYSWL